MHIKTVLFLFSFCFIALQLSAQEYLLGLTDNPALGENSLKSAQVTTDTVLQLPFLDDFSDTEVYPNARRWMDQYAFINHTYAIGPVSYGVATFDALDAAGKHYANAGEKPYPADTLTSLPIKMDSVDLSSLYLSFYYQPQGNGYAPEKTDSLLLQLKDTAGRWQTRWHSLGTSYTAFRTDTLGIAADNPSDTLEFKQVMLSLNDSAYLHAGFQFRFVNYASLTPTSRPSEATNNDMWNIDYVYLNDGRDAGDTIFEDIAFVKASRSFLRNYTAIPWEHYPYIAESQLTTMRFYVRNNGAQKNTISPGKIHFAHNESEWSDSVNIGSYEIAAFSNNDDAQWPFSESPLEHNTDKSASFTVTSTLQVGDQDFISSNDTISRTYTFENYYAYDDGTAERRYGISANGGYVAYRFTSGKADKLRGAKIFFPRNNPEEDAAESFALCVWDDDENDEGKPGTLRLMETGKSTNYGQGLNQFATILFDSVITVEGTFHIGWQQLSDSYLNIGFDMNNVNNTRINYNITGTWYNSDFLGSLMIRPLLSQDTIIGVQEKSPHTFTLYPNPTQNTFSLAGLENIARASIRIFNLSGQLLKKVEWEQTAISINDLNAGLYLVQITSKEAVFEPQRLLVLP